MLPEIWAVRTAAAVFGGRKEREKVIDEMELQNCINYLLTVAQHEVFQAFSNKLAQFNITPGQYGVLGCLWENGWMWRPLAGWEKEDMKSICSIIRSCSL